MIKAFIKKGCFQDSVSLMLISKQLSQLENINEVSVMMGTPANKSLLQNTGFWSDEFDDATPNDICVGIKTSELNSDVITLIAQQLDALLKSSNQQQNGVRLLKARRLSSAIAKLPNANLILISIAGEYASELAHEALDKNLNVMLFSDNISLNDEVNLKRKASDKGLIVMGPDCGTSIIASAPLAFANVIPKGNIGIIGASGTGIQEITSQITLHQQGISHAIGLGGRDLSKEVGGISAFTALKMLANDHNTTVITFVSKPPAETIRQAIIDEMNMITKPIVALFLGYKPTKKRDNNIYFATTLDEAARIASQLSKIAQIVESIPLVQREKIYGLYTGGTLAYEAAMLLAEELNVPLPINHDKGIMLDTTQHKIIDLGDDFYTVGRPHPMIDPSIREQEIIKLAHNSQVSILLIDVVIGYGATEKPAESVISGMNKVNQLRNKDNQLIVIATVVGTEQDPQNRMIQINLLRDAGVIVLDSLPETIMLAIKLIRQSKSGQSIQQENPLLANINVINAGLRNFAENLQSANIPVVHYQWAPIAGGNTKLANILKKLN